MLFGTCCTTNSISKTIKEGLDTLLIIFKRKLILSGDEKFILSETELETMIESQIMLEKFSTNNVLFKKKWGSYVDIP